MQFLGERDAEKAKKVEVHRGLGTVGLTGLQKRLKKKQKKLIKKKLNT